MLLPVQIFVAGLSLAIAKSSETEDLSGTAFLVHPYSNVGLSVALNDTKMSTTLTSNKRQAHPLKLSRIKKNKYKLNADGVYLCVRDSLLGACKAGVKDTFKLEEVQKPNYKREGKVKGNNERFFKISTKLKLSKLMFMTLGRRVCLTARNGQLIFKSCSKYNVDQVFSFEEHEENHRLKGGNDEEEDESGSDEVEDVPLAPMPQQQCTSQCLPPPFNYNGPVHCWNCTGGTCTGCRPGVAPMPVPMHYAPVPTGPAPVAGGCDLNHIRSRVNVPTAPCLY